MKKIAANTFSILAPVITLNTLSFDIPLLNIVKFINLPICHFLAVCKIAKSNMDRA